MNPPKKTPQEKLIDMLERRLGVPSDAVHPDTTFDDLGLDSLALTEFSLAIKKELGVRLNEELESHSTIGDTVKLLESKGVRW